jgi:hypothetical protein
MRAASILSRAGKLGIAPPIVHAKLPAAAARRMAAGMVAPRIRAEASTPTKRSPAPVLSMAVTGNASTRHITSSRAPIAPFAPSVMTTVLLRQGHDQIGRFVVPELKDGAQGRCFMFVKDQHIHLP